MDSGELRKLLNDRPDLEGALEEVLSTDDSAETWNYDDVAIDSGEFGELVDAGVVESHGDAYRLADPEVVEQALAAENIDRGDTRSFGSGTALKSRLSYSTVDRTAATVLAGLLLTTVVFRASTYRSVFRERVVYPANDPYAYVYYVEAGLQNGWTLSQIPAQLVDQEPLTTAMLLGIAELAGGFGNHGFILAWSPVIAAVATALVLYLFALEVTDDRRVALASVFVLAILPAHVTRTSLGFVDHHAFDYFWLTLTAWGTVATINLKSLATDWETLRAITLLAIGISGSVLAWWAATLLLFPIAVAIVVAGAIAIRDDDSLRAPGLAMAAGVGTGAAGVVFANLAWGWHDPVIVIIPAILTVGILGITGATYIWRDLALPAWGFAALTISGTLSTVAGVILLAPTAWQRIHSQLLRLFRDDNIVEMQSIFGTETMGWLFSFGFLLFVIVPVMIWGVYRTYCGDRRWLVASSYAWFLIFLTGIQSRYAGEFALFGALFAGLALVALAERVDAARPPVPFGGEDRQLSFPGRNTTARIAVVVLLLCGLSAVLAPIAASNVSIPEGQYQTALFIDNHAENNDHEYPDSYVFSPWSANRMYNYHVNGESRVYSNAYTHYRPFSLSEDPETAYEAHIKDRQADESYLVTEPVPGNPELSAATMQSRLHDRYGSRAEDVRGLSHYRALYTSPSGDYKVFRVVEGATIRGHADAGTTVTVKTSVDIEGAEFTYERQTTADEDEEFAVTVSYPGEYTFEGIITDPVIVEESSIVNGEDIRTL